MRRTAILTGALTLLCAGVGCRSTCGDRLVNRLRSEPPAQLASAPRDPCCPDGVPALSRSIGVPGYGTGLVYPPNMGYGFPVYPSGTPMPYGNGGSPSNELPYPRIPSPGLPEGPAQPLPAVPQVGALPTPGRTTADLKGK